MTSPPVDISSASHFPDAFSGLVSTVGGTADTISDWSIDTVTSFNQFFWGSVFSSVGVVFRGSGGDGTTPPTLSSSSVADFLLPLDAVRHFTTDRDQSLWENGWTGLMYFCLIFLCLIPTDFLFTRPLTWLMLRCFGSKDKKDQYPSPAAVKKSSWFLLHATFNMFVVLVSWKEAVECFLDPGIKAFEPQGWWGSHRGSMLGTIAIGAFHIHHFVFFEFTFEDIVHHLGNAGVVVVIGVMCPWGRATALSNLAMCGVPGALNYFAMWLRKGNLISVPHQKELNRFCNVVLRYPVQLSSFYVMLINLAQGRLPPLNTATFFFMWIGMIAETFNALYYCDQVVGNYWIFRSDKMRAAAAAAEKEKEAACATTKSPTSTTAPVLSVKNRGVPSRQKQKPGRIKNMTASLGC